MGENNKISKVDNSIALIKAGNMIGVTNKLVQNYLTNDEKEIVEFLLKYQDRFNFSLNLISKHYPLTYAMIDEFQGIINWDLLSSNENICWSTEYLSKVINSGYLKSSWALSRNNCLPWSINFIEKHNEFWDWSQLSQNKSLPWTDELIERFINKWDWEELSRNQSLPWSIEMIQKFDNYWNFGLNRPFFSLSNNKSLPWSPELIERYSDRWDWDELCGNPGLPWTVDFFIWFQKKGKANNLFKRLSENEKFPWSFEFLDKYKTELDWASLSLNSGLPWSMGLIEKYEKYWHFSYERNLQTGSLDRNEGLPWSIELLEKYQNRWNWEQICYNKSIQWSLKLMEHFQSRLDGCNWNYLNFNKNLPWSHQLIEKYHNNWNWYDLHENADIFKYNKPSNKVINKFIKCYCE